jgi:alanine racemase
MAEKVQRLHKSWLCRRISRGWGNAGFVTIKDKKQNFGSICMDMLMVDVTEINCTRRDSVNFMKAQLLYCKKSLTQYL